MIKLLKTPIIIFLFFYKKQDSKAPMMLFYSLVFYSEIQALFFKLNILSYFNYIFNSKSISKRIN